MDIMERLRTGIKLRFVSLMMVIASLIALGTAAYHYLENWTWAQCFYFSVVTLTTVGYGDLHPTTDASRMFTAAYVLVGVGTMLFALTTIASSYLKMTEHQTIIDHERWLKRRKKKHQEPVEYREDE